MNFFDSAYKDFPAESNTHPFGIDITSSGESGLRIGLREMAAGGFEYKIWQ